MKIRNGFVSNSSSSSFIVFFTHKPKTKEELKEMMFKNWNDEEIIAPAWYDETDGISVKSIIERVFNDLDKESKLPKEALLNGHTEIENDRLIEILRECSFESSAKHYNIYHQLGKKYGYEINDQDTKWKSDELYKEYLKTKKIMHKNEKDYYKCREKMLNEYYNNFKKIHKDCKFIKVFEYGDRHGEDMLEHGNIFRKLPHIVVSNH